MRIDVGLAWATYGVYVGLARARRKGDEATMLVRQRVEEAPTYAMEGTEEGSCGFAVGPRGSMRGWCGFAAGSMRGQWKVVGEVRLAERVATTDKGSMSNRRGVDGRRQRPTMVHY